MFRGSIVALATPFNEQNQVDFRTLCDLIEWQIESGTDGIVLCGSTGEDPTLSHAEKLQIFKEGVLAAKGRIPIIAGTGCNDTARSVHLTLQAKEAGVDGALLILPYYNRPTPEGCFLHYQELSKIGLPLIIYDNPGRTGIRLSVQSMKRLCELPHIVGIKDATGNLDYALELMHQVKTPILSGDDSFLLPQMASGACGVISIVANIIPRQWKILTTLLLSDQINEAREFFYRYYSLVKSMVLETNPQCVKFALGAMGKCSPKLRLPLIEPQDVVKQQIIDAMVKAELLFRKKQVVIA